MMITSKNVLKQNSPSCSQPWTERSSAASASASFVEATIPMFNWDHQRSFQSPPSPTVVPFPLTQTTLTISRGENFRLKTEAAETVIDSTARRLATTERWEIMLLKREFHHPHHHHRTLCPHCYPHLSNSIQL